LSVAISRSPATHQSLAKGQEDAIDTPPSAATHPSLATGQEGAGTTPPSATTHQSLATGQEDAVTMKRFKFQILWDHLNLEKALLIAN